MSFERIVGQAAAGETLKKRIEADSLPHALLFSGPSGVGKKTVALELARALLCEKRTGRPCGVCAACGRAERLSHPDLIVVSPAESGQMGIPEIRNLIGRAQLKSFSGGVKIAILDGADALTDEAQNAFLKILEEPPSGTYFILLASETGRLYPTILSRCQKIGFRELETGEVKTILARDPELGAGEAARLAERSGGSAETALRRRDFDAAGVEDGVFRLIGEAARGDVSELPDRGKVKREEALFEIDAAADLFRDLYLLKTAPEGAEKRLTFADRRAELDKLARAYPAEAIESALEAAAEARDAVEHSANLRMVFSGFWIACGVKFF